MARYIDADKLITHLKDEIKGCEIPFGSRANGKGVAYGTALGLKSAISFVETLSTADVVPKSEVLKIFEELETEITAALKSNYEARRAYNPTDEFHMWVQGKIDALCGIDGFIAEFKKKYTEGE